LKKVSLRPRAVRLANRHVLVFPDMGRFCRMTVRCGGPSRPLCDLAIVRGRPIMNDIGRTAFAAHQQIDRVDGIDHINRLDEEGGRRGQAIGIRQTIKIAAQEDDRQLGFFLSRETSQRDTIDRARVFDVGHQQMHILLFDNLQRGMAGRRPAYLEAGLRQGAVENVKDEVFVVDKKDMGCAISASLLFVAARILPRLFNDTVIAGLRKQ